MAGTKAVHKNAAGVAARCAVHAGRHSGYWRGLLENAALMPMKKPEPKPEVQRLPKGQLRKLLSLMKNNDAIDSRRAKQAIAGCVGSIGKLHADDIRRICRGLLDSPLSVRKNAAAAILRLPEEERVAMIEKYLAKRKFLPSDTIFRTVFKACSAEGRERLARAMLEYPSIPARIMALKLIGELPREKRTGIVKAALDIECLTDDAFRRIGMCPAKDRAELVRAGLRSPRISVREEASTAMLSLPASEHFACALIVTTDAMGTDAGAGVFDCAIKSCGKLEKAMLARAGMKSHDPRLQKMALRLVPFLPKRRRTAFVKAAFGKKHLALAAFECISVCPEKDKAMLIRAAIMCGVKEVKEKAYAAIGPMDEREKSRLRDRLIADLWGASRVFHYVA